ncbi:MAG: hypothetical protein ACK4E7_09695 [Permianibacter sp.]
MAPFRKSLSALLVGFSLSPVAWSLGFGELQLQSELNQPLQAEIPILGVPAYASDSVRIRLGKREDFSALGYDYAPEIDGIRAELVQRDTRLVLQLRSRDALREPLLNLVLVAEEGNTRYLRDYAILLDLPGSRSAAVNGVGAASTTASAATVSTPIVSATIASATAITSPVTTTPSAVAATAATTTATVYGPTQPGESLSQIAYRLGKAAGVEWQAYGVALYHANPTAFLAGDPNRLKAAVPLQLPGAGDVARYQRSDWQALFAGPVATRATRASAATVASETSATSVAAATDTTSAPAVALVPAETPVSASTLANLQQQNIELKTELAAATARMQALEAQLARLDNRYQALTAQAPVNAAPAVAAAPATGQNSVTVTPDNLSASTPAATTPVRIEVRDQLASADNAVPAPAATSAEVTTPNPPSVWSLIAWPLAVLVALIIAGVAFWQWRERRQHDKLLQPRAKAPRAPKPVLPAAEVDEPAVPQIEVGSADRRILKIKQVQSALETYLAYQRFDRALELLEHEMHIAGDDLVLRRQLQRLQKDVRNAQSEWQESHKEQMSELFDRATTTHIDKPVARDDGKKTLG